MSSKEDQITDGTVVKETPSEDHSLRVSMENLRLRDDGHHTRGSQSRRFEDGHSQMIDPLEIGNVETVPEKLKQAHVVISAEQDSYGYQGDQQIQGKRKPKITEKEENTIWLLWRTSVLGWYPDPSENLVKLMT